MLELFFSACGAGACIVLMMLIAKDFYQSVAARAFFVLIFGAFVYLCHAWLPKSLWPFAYMIESSTPAFFWISSRLIFQEGKPLPRLGLFIALHSFITPAAALLLGLDINSDPAWLVFVTRTIPQWFEYLLIIMGMVALLRGREDGFYRRENLTLKDLAVKMSLPEYRVRAVINKELQYRNFNEFINEYRISEAAERLIAEPDTPISNIALDVGYRTLSSFNRAFRKEKETTPTAFRERS